MKKFFSLVLALVMALSLTTVAFGADATVSDATELKDALAQAQSGDTITLDASFEVNFAAPNAGSITIPAGVTIDGDGNTITLTGAVVQYSSSAAFFNKTAAANLVIQDLKITNNLTQGYVFDFADATLNNVDITGGRTFGLIVMRNGAAGDEVVVKDCDFADYKGEAVSTESGANTPLIIEDSTFTGAEGLDATAVIFRNNESSSVGSTYNANFVLYADDATEITGNTFNDEVNLWFSDVSLTGNSFGSDATIELKNGATDIDVSNNYWGGGAPTAAQLGGATADVYYSEPDMTGITGVASAPASAVKGAYLTANMDTLSVYPGLDLDTYTYSLEHYVTGNAVAKTFDQKALWATHKLTGAKVIEEVFVVAASAESADYAFVNGAQITYLNDVVGYTGTVSVLPTIDAEDAAKCGDMFVGGDYAAYTDANAKMYVEKAGGTVYNVDGKYVELVPAAVATPVVGDLKTLTPVNYTLYMVGHTYDYDAETVKGDKTVTAVFCEECDAQFAFVEGTLADAVKKFGAGNFYDNTVTKLGIADLYVAKTAGAAGSAGTSTDVKVESAATFDAGIAMYVGMSVLAATGSAVVLKKKD